MKDKLLQNDEGQDDPFGILLFVLQVLTAIGKLQYLVGYWKRCYTMLHPATGTPLPPLILTPGGLVPISASQNPMLDPT
eukprot:5913357-Amphidinium_carterae.1